MVTITNANAQGPLSLSRLNDFEKRIRVRLPEDYRRFLLEYNGGKPDPACFWIQQPVDGSQVRRFYALVESGPPPTLYTYAGPLRYGVPEDLLPIADDGLGNLVCIGVAPVNYGAIFFFDHDLIRPGGRNAQAAIRHLAASFTEFISSLAPDPRESPHP